MKATYGKNYDLYTTIPTEDFPLEMFLKEDLADGHVYLPLEGREQWFRYRYPHGKVDTKTEYLDREMAVVTAKVYKDVADGENEYLASVTAERTRANWGRGYHDMATQAAITMALTAAGYGTPLVIRHQSASTMLEVPPYIDEIDVEHPIALRNEQAQVRRQRTVA